MELVRILVDFGLVVLIWLVQLCIYPAFTYFEEKDLQKWHATYTWRITLVVLPLMFTQLLVSIYQLFVDINSFTLSYFFLVILTWILTFTIYVPLHQKIDTQKNKILTSSKLVSLNWWRVFLWMLIFLLSFLKK